MRVVEEEGSELHFLYCDESNLEEKAGDFFLYGGIMIEGSNAKALSHKIDEIRGRLKVPRDYKLKFNPGPEGFTNDQFIELKEEIIKAVIAHNACLIIYAVLHDIAHNPDEARRYGINTVCYNFHCILKRFDGTGIVLIDRFNDRGNKIDGHLVEKFSIGVKAMPFSEEIRLDNIVGFHYSAIGQSHFASVIDVILGSVRFSVNSHTRNETHNLGTAKKILGLLEPLFYREKAGEPVSELSITFSPKVIKKDEFQKKYQSLKDFLAAAGVNSAQKI